MIDKAITVSIEHDIRNSPSWPLMYDDFCEQHRLEPLSVVQFSLAAGLLYEPKDYEEFIQTLKAFLSRLTKESEMGVLLFNYSSFLNSRVSRHKKLLKSNILIDAKVRGAFSEEIELQYDDGLRFATFGWLASSDCEWLSRLLQKFETVIPVFSKEQQTVSSAEVRDLMNSCFSVGSFDWAKFSSICQERGWMCLQRIVFPEEGRYFFNLFGSSEQVKIAARSFEEELLHFQ